jgi:hypothetical protein
MTKKITAIFIFLALTAFSAFGLASKTFAANVGVMPVRGDTSKINERSVRQTAAESLKNSGFSVDFADSTEKFGNFDYSISVEVKSSKKTSEITLIASLFDKNGKKIGTSSGTARTGADDSIKPLVRGLIGELSRNMR